MAQKFHLPNVYALYIDSIHGFALGKEGLLVAANCTSCHGSHKIPQPYRPAKLHLPHQHPTTPAAAATSASTSNIRLAFTAKLVAAGNASAPVCTDCHTAHGIVEPTSAASACSPRPSAAPAIAISSAPIATPSTRSSACSAAMLKPPAAGIATGRTKSCPHRIPTRPSIRPT
jgi:hypothetical protein